MSNTNARSDFYLSGKANEEIKAGGLVTEVEASWCDRTLHKISFGLLGCERRFEKASTDKNGVVHGVKVRSND